MITLDDVRKTENSKYSSLESALALHNVQHLISLDKWMHGADYTQIDVIMYNAFIKKLDDLKKIYMQQAGIDPKIYGDLKP